MKLTKGDDFMKLVSALHEDGSNYFIPLNKITLKKDASDSFSMYKHQIHFDENVFDISEEAYNTIIKGYMNDAFGMPGLNQIITIKLGERL